MLGETINPGKDSSINPSCHRTRTPPEEYLTAVQQLCRKYNVLFLCDEVQSGFGRTGYDLAYQREPGVQPDLVALGKALTGGTYAIRACINQKLIGAMV